MAKTNSGTKNTKMRSSKFKNSKKQAKERKKEGIQNQRLDPGFPEAGCSAIPKEPAKKPIVRFLEGDKKKVESIEEIEASYLFPGTHRQTGPICTADVYRDGFFRDSFLSFCFILFLKKETMRISNESSGGGGWWKHSVETGP